MINRGGPSLLVRIADQTGASAASVAAAFAAVRDSYGMTALNGEIDALDNKISGKLQLELYQAVQDLLLDRLVWFLRNVDLTQGLGVDRCPLSRLALQRSRPRLTTCCRTRPLRRAGSAKPSSRREACRPSLRAVSPRCGC